MLDDIESKKSALKQAYHGKMTRLRSKYLEARKLLNQNFGSDVNLEIPLPPTPPEPKPEPPAEPRLSVGHEWHLSKTSDWPNSQ